MIRGGCIRKSLKSGSESWWKMPWRASPVEGASKGYSTLPFLGVHFNPSIMHDLQNYIIPVLYSFPRIRLVPICMPPGPKNNAIAIPRDSN